MQTFDVVSAHLVTHMDGCRPARVEKSLPLAPTPVAKKEKKEKTPKLKCGRHPVFAILFKLCSLSYLR